MAKDKKEKQANLKGFTGDEEDRDDMEDIKSSDLGTRSYAPETLEFVAYCEIKVDVSDVE